MKRTPERVESGHFLAKHNVSVVVHADQVEHRLAKVNANCTDTHLVSPRCGFVLPSSPDAASFTRQTILLLPLLVKKRTDWGKLAITPLNGPNLRMIRNHLSVGPHLRSSRQYQIAVES